LTQPQELNGKGIGLCVAGHKVYQGQESDGNSLDYVSHFSFLTALMQNGNNAALPVKTLRHMLDWNNQSVEN